MKRIFFKPYYSLEQTFSICYNICVRQILILYILALSVPAFADDTSYVPTFNEFPCKSPEAFAFQRYGEFQADGYTGNPGISIPLYSLTYKDITIPLTLSYDGSGVRVRQEASWVGLGWNLNVGGCINYVSQGVNDQSFSRAATSQEYMNLCGIRSGNPYQLYTPLNEAATPDPQIGYFLSAGLYQDLTNGLGERDYYSASFLGQSFLFFVNPADNHITIIGDDSQKYKVEQVNLDWRVTDVNGYTYYFIATEYSQEGRSANFTSAWSLSRIDSPTGAYVTITYTSDYYTFGHIPDIQQTYEIEKNGNWTAGYNAPAFQSSISSGTWAVRKKYPVSIEGGNNFVKVTFEYSDRTDLPGSKKIEAFRITSMSNGSYKKIRFRYGHFYSCTTGGSYLHHANEQVEDRYKKRLKLLSIQEISSDRRDTIKTEFGYYGDDNGSMLPMKTSSSVDFWGYFNGSENAVTATTGVVTGDQHIILPALEDCYGQSNINEIATVKDQILSVRGANRFCNETFMKTGTLKKIVYPTKGYSQFEYEAHRFYADATHSYVFKESGAASSGTTYMARDINSSNPNAAAEVHKAFNVTSQSTGTITIKMTAETPEKMYLLRQSQSYAEFISNGMEVYGISSLSTDASGLVLTKNIYNVSLSPSTYHLVAVLADNLGSGYSVSISITVHPILSGTARQSIGGGLRIKSIANYDSDNRLLQTRRYEYGDGKSLVPMKLFNTVSRYTYNEASSTHNNYFLTFHSSMIGNSAFTSSVSKGGIGYSSVTERIYDGSNNLMKRVVSTYRNDFASDVFGEFYQFDNYTNGNLLTRSIYDGNNALADSIVNSYTLQSGNAMTCNLMLQDLYSDPRCTASGRFRLIAYSYQNKWNVLSATKHFSFLNNIARSTESTYSYNSQNRLVSEEKTRDTQSAALTQKNFRYPCDITGDPVCNSMTTNHYLSPVIEEKYTIQGREKYRKRAVYSTLQGLFVHTRDSISLNGGPMEKRMDYTYNQQANLVCMVKDNTEPVTYLWSYRQSLPIAEIKGANYSQVSQWLGSTVNSIGSSSSFTRTQALSIQSQLASHGAIATMYLHDPVWGVTSQILPNGVTTTYLYDIFGRLGETRDRNNHSIGSFNYNYRR